MSEQVLDLVVTAVERVADDVVQLVMGSADGGRLPAWTPGAHIDLRFPDGLERQYSLCGDPSDRAEFRVAVLLRRDGGGGSAAAHRLVVGQRIAAGGPRNHFELEPSRRYIFIAGGIGITPILPMIRDAEAAGAQWHLYYAGRRESSMAFIETVRSHAESVTVSPSVEDGRLDLDEILGAPVPDTLIYACGPEPLLTAIEERASRWPGSVLHIERFVAGDFSDAVNHEFDVVLETSGMTLHVGSQESILEVMHAAGVPVVSSCRRGICGTCEQHVLSGEVEHRDAVLNDEERETNEYMMICVSRAKGTRLVLDA